MNATEFTKTKMHFTIGLLAALFALHPFFPQFDKIHFTYMGTVIPLSYAFMAIGVLLAGAVYFYATDLMSEQSSTLSQRLGNWLYALAIMMVPFYAGMYLTTLLENYLITNEMLGNVNLQTPAITIGILVFWLVLWQLGGVLLRHYMTARDWISRIDQMADSEMDALKRAKDLLEADHADLAIIQFSKAVNARLKMATMKRGYFQGDPLVNARKCGIINKVNGQWLDVILKNAAVAASVHPVEPGAAQLTAEATKRLLSTVPV